MKEIKIESGKYTFVETEMDSYTYVIMNGWREFLGDKAINALFQYAADMREELLSILYREVLDTTIPNILAETTAISKSPGQEWGKEQLVAATLKHCAALMPISWNNRAKLVLGLKE